MECNVLSKVQNLHPKPICDHGHQECKPKKQRDKNGWRKTKLRTSAVVRFDQLNLVL